MGMGKTHRHSNPELAAAMRELRQGSRTDRHRNRKKYRRADWRNAAQSGKIEP